MPVIVYPVLSYLDLLVEHGYPLVARNEPHAALLLRRLAASPQLRQQASELGLAIAAKLTTQKVAEEVAGQVCEWLAGPGEDQKKARAAEAEAGGEPAR